MRVSPNRQAVKTGLSVPNELFQDELTNIALHRQADHLISKHYRVCVKATYRLSISSPKTHSLGVEMINFGRLPIPWLAERADLPVSFLRHYLGYRNFIIITIGLIAAMSFWLSVELRDDFQATATQSHYRIILTLAVAIFKVLVFILVGSHRSNWRYTGLKDMERLMAFNVVATALLWCLCYLDGFGLIRRGVILIDFFMNSVLVGGLFFALRMYRERLLNLRQVDGSAPWKKVIIFGAGDGGESLVRELLRNQHDRWSVEAFFDDDPHKIGVEIHGIPVKGTLNEIADYVKTFKIDMVIIAIPSATKEKMRDIYNRMMGLGITVKTLPPLREILKGRPSISQLRDIEITDLLGRNEIIRVDQNRLNSLISSKTVLVTGAGGSIGSELCLQVLREEPAQLLLVERSENSLFQVHRRLLEYEGKTEIIPILCDVTNEFRVLQEFIRYKPHLVFHAAAHKHVPLQELNPSECIRNNVGGTAAVVKASHTAGVERFIFISTDKAVNPRSIMGASKRLCEIYCQDYAGISNTQFMSVRFGNVLGSAGSVLPIFLDQISKGEPITITHPDMQRYFMTIPEAVTLVVQAAAIGSSGQILVLDMGNPIKIVDLARQLLHIIGKPIDYPIEFIGCRPGEKLIEELSCDEECCVTSVHESILVFNPSGRNGGSFIGTIDVFLKLSLESSHRSEVIRFISSIVPEYDPGHFELSQNLEQLRLNAAIN